ncbi:hypothetical protein MJD09_26175 [bacterium]|nr:hypothetical protein [bacterium]
MDPLLTEIDAERKKMRRLRTLVDCTASILYQANLTHREALNLVAATRKAVFQLFPGKEETYDLIYKPRFERILKERLKSN